MKEYLRNGFTRWLKWLTLKISIEFHYRKQHLKIGYMSILIELHPNNYNTIYENVYLNNVTLGDFTYISKDTSVMNTTIGKFCSIGQGCQIGIGLHPIDYVSTHPIFYSSKRQAQIAFESTDVFEEYKHISIGHDVWIGNRVIINDGLEIGNGSIIAAGSVVTKDIPPYAIVGGVPAKIIRYRFEVEEIKKLEKFSWWNKDVTWLKTHCKQMQNPDEFFKIIDKVGT